MKRFIRFIIGVLLIILVVSTIDGALKDRYKVVAFEVVVADSGDTLWGLCKRVNSDILESGDVGECVHHLSQSNPKLRNLQPGDSVKVPVLVLND